MRRAENSPTMEYIPTQDRPISMLGPVFGAHIERIGAIRVVIGGGSMYLYIPFMILLHTTFATLYYQLLLRPLLGTPKVRWADHVVIDRYRIEGLTWFDKFNCMFCAYANGVCTMMNRELDYASTATTPLPLYKKILALPFATMLGVFMLIGELPIQIIFNVLVSRPLGMHRVSFRQAQYMLRQEGYGRSLWAPLRWGVLMAKNHLVRFAMALEQIESSWCPLKHFETRKGIVYPKHHEPFFGPEQIRSMYDVLRTTGTVSSRKPTW